MFLDWSRRGIWVERCRAAGGCDSGEHREVNGVAVVQPQRASKVDLAEQFDLVCGVAGLVRLNGDPPVPIGDKNRNHEVTCLPTEGLPVRADLRGIQIAPARAPLDWRGQANVQRAGQRPEADQLS